MGSFKWPAGGSGGGGVSNPLTGDLDADGNDINNVGTIRSSEMRVGDLTSPRNNGVGVVGFTFDTPQTYTGDAKLLGGNNNGSEKWYIDKDGNFCTIASGTYTPIVTLVGGAGNTVPVYTTNRGRWQRFGKRVWVDIFLDGDGGAEGAGTGLLYISLPVAVPADASGWYVPGGFVRNGSAAYTALVAAVAGSSTLSLGYINGTSIADMDGTFQNNATRLINLSFSYEVD